MPPPQRLLSIRIRGFVCKSCLSKLQIPRRQQIPWIGRRFASDNRPRRPEGAYDLPNGTVRYFEQTPDGVRTEIDDEEDAAFMESVRKQLKDIENETGRTMDDLEDEDLEKILQNSSLGLEEEDLDDIFEDGSSSLREASELEDALDSMASKNEEMQAQIDLVESIDLDNISEKDRLKLRETLLKSVERGMIDKFRNYVKATNAQQTRLLHLAPPSYQKRRNHSFHFPSLPTASRYLLHLFPNSIEIVFYN